MKWNSESSICGFAFPLQFNSMSTQNRIIFHYVVNLHVQNLLHPKDQLLTNVWREDYTVNTIYLMGMNASTLFSFVNNCCSYQKFLFLVLWLGLNLNNYFFPNYLRFGLSVTYLRKV